MVADRGENRAELTIVRGQSPKSCRFKSLLKIETVGTGDLLNGSKCVWLAVCLMVGTGLQMSAQETPKQVPSTQETPKPELKPLPDAPEAAAGDALYAPLAVGQDSFKTKENTWLVQSFGPRALASPMISAGIRMARPNHNYPPEWRDGMDGFARQYGSSLGTKFAGNTARFAVAALTHEDYRYRPSESKEFGARVFHAVGYIFVDQSDQGKPRLALANFAGAAAGGFVPNAWLPDGFNTWQDGAKRMGTKFGGFAIQDVLREFAPEIFEVVHHSHLPFPRLPVPEWWTKDIKVARRP